MQKAGLCKQPKNRMRLLKPTIACSLLAISITANAYTLTIKSNKDCTFVQPSGQLLGIIFDNNPPRPPAEIGEYTYAAVIPKFTYAIKLPYYLYDNKKQFHQNSVRCLSYGKLITKQDITLTYTYNGGKCMAQVTPAVPICNY